LKDNLNVLQRPTSFLQINTALFKPTNDGQKTDKKVKTKLNVSLYFTLPLSFCRFVGKNDYRYNLLCIKEKQNFKEKLKYSSDNMLFKLFLKNKHDELLLRCY